MMGLHISHCIAQVLTPPQRPVDDQEVSGLLRTRFLSSRHFCLPHALLKSQREGFKTRCGRQTNRELPGSGLHGFRLTKRSEQSALDYYGTNCGGPVAANGTRGV
jgi:hypothetical protein